MKASRRAFCRGVSSSVAVRMRAIAPKAFLTSYLTWPRGLVVRGSAAGGGSAPPGRRGLPAAGGAAAGRAAGRRGAPGIAAGRLGRRPRAAPAAAHQPQLLVDDVLGAGLRLPPGGAGEAAGERGREAGAAGRATG